METNIELDGRSAAIGRVCRLTGADRTARIDAVGAFVARASGVAPIPGGVRLTFPRTAEAARAIIDFVKVERDCCSSVRYDVARQGDEPTLDLDIVGDGAEGSLLQAFYLGLARPRSAGGPDDR